MRGVFALVLLAGLGLAGGAAKLVMDHINTLTGQRDLALSNIAPAVEMTEIILVKKDLRSGQTLSTDDVIRVGWPKEFVPDGIFVDAAELFPEGAQPRVVLNSMVAGEPVLKAKLSKPGAPIGLAFQLQPGERAFTLKVDVSSGVSGFLRPGDRVDIYWTGTPPGGNGQFTRLLKTSVKLLAIDQFRDADQDVARVARTVTVATTPQEVAELAQAQNSGRLTLSLVGAADEDSLVSVIEVDQKELLGIEEVEATDIERKKVCTIRNRRGAEVIIMEIPCVN
ncbi:MAG: Flp pilus assembly protein CpaB [Rhodobacteraceae bacterium]|nr:Flp pilus assembly protein CpaB [Paracoccaceae bacterium]